MSSRAEENPQYIDFVSQRQHPAIHDPNIDQRPESTQFLVAPPPEPLPQLEIHQNAIVPNEINIPIINNEEEYPNYRQLLFEFTYNVFFSHVFSILYAAHFVFDINYIYCFIPLFVWDLYDILLIGKNMKRFLISSKLKRRYFLMMLERYNVMILKAMVLIYFETHYFLMSYTLVPLIFYCFIRCVTYSIDKNSGECHTMIDFLAVAYRMFILIQGITLCCKIDNFIDWEWKEVFWSYWVFFSILIGIDFGLILMTISKFCNCFLGNIDWVELKGLFWFMIVSLCFTVCTCLLNLGTSSILDTQNKEVLQQFLYFTLGSFVTNLTIILFLKNSLILFLKGVNQDEDNSKSKKENKHEDNPSFVVPRFLSKFSSTYFKKVDIDTPQLNELEKNKKKHKNKKKMKKKKYKPISQKTSKKQFI